jgi:hypothetical protein
MDAKTRVIYDENQFMRLLDKLSEVLPLKRRSIFLLGEEREPVIQLSVHVTEGPLVEVCFPSGTSVVELTMLILYGYAFGLAVDSCSENPQRLPAQAMCDAVARVCEALKDTNVAATNALATCHHSPRLVGALIRGGVSIEGEEETERAVAEIERDRARVEETQAAMTRSRVMWHMQGASAMRNPKC